MMRKIKLVLAILGLVFAVGCEDDDRSTQFVDEVAAPSNVALLFNVSQDNSGLVTMTPSAEGALLFDIFLGDGTIEPITIEPGETIDNVYEEGTYTVKAVAKGINGLTTELDQQLVVSFIPPQNLEVSIANDGAVSNTVRVTATADFAINYEVDFGEVEGDEDVRMANIGEEIVYEYAAPGTYTITVTAFSAAIETTQFVEENFEVTEVLAPIAGAPVPSVPAANVIAIYSDSYTPITTNEFPTEWSDSGYEEIQVEGNNTIKYTDLAFTGIVTDYENPTDLSVMEFIHFDYWSPDASALSFKMVNTTLDPVQEDIESAGDIVQGEWVSVDIPLDDFEMDRTAVTQLLFDTLGNRAIVYIDNIYFYVEAPSAPLVAAPTPNIAAEDVIAIYSDAYTPITTNEFPTPWSDSGYNEIQIEGNNTINYFDLLFTGIVTDYGNPTDLTGMDFVHFDYWTPDATSLGIKLVNTTLDPVQEDIESPDAVELGKWVGVDIPLDDFEMDRSAVTQILFDALGNRANVFIDNLYFYRTPAQTPETAAPSPTLPAENVKSMYSNEYADAVVVDSWRSDWSTGILTDIQIEGNDTKEYIDVDFVGVEFYSGLDVTDMTTFHVDVFTGNATTFRVKLVDLGTGNPIEGEIAFENLPLGQWVSLEIPLADFADPAKVTNPDNTLTVRDSLQQLIFSGLPLNTFDFYIDNVYFHN